MEKKRGENEKNERLLKWTIRKWSLHKAKVFIEWKHQLFTASPCSHVYFFELNVPFIVSVVADVLSLL